MDDLPACIAFQSIDSARALCAGRRGMHSDVPVEDVVILEAVEEA